MKRLLIVIFCSLALPGFIQNLHSADFLKTDVEKMIFSVEKRLEEIQRSELKNYGAEDIPKIQERINTAKEYIAKNDLLRAYYEISLGKAYFEKIEAKMEYQYSKKAYEQTVQRSDK